MPSEYFPQWRNSNSQRAYPFEDSATRTSADSGLVLEDHWLVDAAIYPTQGIAPYAIGTIIVEQAEAEIRLVDSQGNVVGSGICGRSDTRPIAVYDGETLVATLVPGDDANHAIFAAGDGVFSFDFGSATFVASCVMPLSQFGGFFGFDINGQTLNGGHLLLIGERGVQLTVSEEQEQQSGGSVADVTKILIHAVGDPQYLSRQCADDSRRPLRFVREIVYQYNDFTHVCRPNHRGNVLMLSGSPSTSDPALQIHPTEGAIIIRLAGKPL